MAFRPPQQAEAQPSPTKSSPPLVPSPGLAADFHLPTSSWPLHIVQVGLDRDLLRPDPRVRIDAPRLHADNLITKRHTRPVITAVHKASTPARHTLYTVASSSRT